MKTEKKECDVCGGKYASVAKHKEKQHSASTTPAEGVGWLQTAANKGVGIVSTTTGNGTDTVADSTPEKSQTKQEGNLSALLEGQADNARVLNTIASALAKLVELQTAKTESSFSNPQTTEPNQKVFTPTLEDESYPTNYVPPAFKKAVNEILSSEFSCRVQDFDDRTDFLFEIVVPEKYSSVSKEDRAKGVEDIRSKMISRALGINGVREWCQLVRKNLNKFYSSQGVQSPFREFVEGSGVVG